MTEGQLEDMVKELGDLSYPLFTKKGLKKSNARSYANAVSDFVYKVAEERGLLKKKLQETEQALASEKVKRRPHVKHYTTCAMVEQIELLQRQLSRLTSILNDNEQAWAEYEQ